MFRTTITKPNVRWLIRRDMPEVLRIEQLCHEYPWTAAEWERTCAVKENIPMVAELDGEIVGYVMYSLHPKHLHILNIAVLPGRWLEGIGRAMLDKLQTKIGWRRNWITAEVRETNLSAQLFFRHCGFGALGMIPNAYQGSDEASILFQYPFDSNAPKPTAR